MEYKKQIEEMAKIIGWNCNEKSIEYCDTVENCGECRAIDLYNAGYRKIPENSVALSREEVEDLKISKNFDYGYYEGERNMEAYYKNIRLPEARKETAREIFKELFKRAENISFFDCRLALNLEELAKQYGVEQ